MRPASSSMTALSARTFRLTPSLTWKAGRIRTVEPRFESSVAYHSSRAVRRAHYLTQAKLHKTVDKRDKRF